MLTKRENKEFPLKEKRASRRRLFSENIRYFVTALVELNTGELKRIYNEGPSVDINEKGLGILTNFPLARGDVLYFEPRITAGSIEADSAIVRWSLKIGKNRYRVGLEFLRWH